jgi:hypothetical protein
MGIRSLLAAPETAFVFCPTFFAAIAIAPGEFEGEGWRGEPPPLEIVEIDAASPVSAQPLRAECFGDFRIDGRDWRRLDRSPARRRWSSFWG